MQGPRMKLEMLTAAGSASFPVHDSRIRGHLGWPGAMGKLSAFADAEPRGSMELSLFYSHVHSVTSFH